MYLRICLCKLNLLEKVGQPFDIIGHNLARESLLPSRSV